MLQKIGDGKINALKHLLLGITLRLQNIKPLLDMRHHKLPLMSRCLGTLVLSLLLITGCKKDEFVCLDGLVVYEAESSADGIDLSDYVIIACEGGFTEGMHPLICIIHQMAICILMPSLNKQVMR